MRKKRRAGRGEAVAFIEYAAKYRADTCLFWPFASRADGYGNILWKGKYVTAHHAVCFEAHGPPPSTGYYAAHKCRHKACIAPRHLRWATPKQNQHDRIADGTSNAGEAHGMAKLTDRQVRYIRRSAKSLSVLSKELKISKSQIGLVRQGLRWKHVR